MKAIENAGDQITYELITLLNTQYITPFDREDIYELATALDDVVDDIEEVSEMLELYGIESTTRPAVEQCRLLVGACEQLSLGLTRLKGMRGVQEHARRAEALRGRRRPRPPRRDRRPLPRRPDRPADRDPLEGHLRGARAGDGRDRERGERDREHRRQERLGARMDDLTLVAVVAVALFFDFTNGFHDTANSIATSVSTRAVSPRAAVISAAILNFAGAFVSLRRRRHDREGDRRRRASITPDVDPRRPRRRDHLEPRHLVPRAALQLEPRADRRHSRLGGRRGRLRRRQVGRAEGEGARCPRCSRPSSGSRSPRR